MRKLTILAATALFAAAAPLPAAAQMGTAGGSMTVTYKDDISTFDPAIGYDWQNWSMIKALFDGLMDYKPGTTELMPDLMRGSISGGDRARQPARRFAGTAD